MYNTALKIEERLGKYTGSLIESLMVDVSRVKQLSSEDEKPLREHCAHIHQKLLIIEEPIWNN